MTLPDTRLPTTRRAARCVRARAAVTLLLGTLIATVIAAPATARRSSDWRSLALEMAAPWPSIQQPAGNLPDYLDGIVGQPRPVGGLAPPGQNGASRDQAALREPLAGGRQRSGVFVAHAADLDRAGHGARRGPRTGRVRPASPRERADPTNGAREGSVRSLR